MAPTWNADNCFTEPELRKLAEQGDIREVTIQEVMEGYIVVVQAHLPIKKGTKWVSGAVDAVWRTRRDLNEPRVFNSLERLMERLSATFPKVGTVQVHLLTEKQRKQKLLFQSQRKSESGEKKAGRPKKIKPAEAKATVAGNLTAKPAKKSASKKLP
ncbi:hypothetical protein JH298_21815 (plasmid) [Xanthomonas campestris pv. campestris]|uniref:hypothetical protein n=1 Tax=Xanthomonas TaxID=338 RepID=UPI000CED8762|nr:hypothetical protein [Xanthomonas arboricola]PPU05593.1 hypothetical protein XarjCFBP1022_20095 [Xanthomonas arboricola]WDJ74929.1 hypothetical protein JH298_21815 [Xanthomonas campestris pv. campestris]